MNAGYGFVTFKEAISVERVMAAGLQHYVCGSKVDIRSFVAPKKDNQMHPL